MKKNVIIGIMISVILLGMIGCGSLPILYSSLLSGGIPEPLFVVLDNSNDVTHLQIDLEKNSPNSIRPIINYLDKTGTDTYFHTLRFVDGTIDEVNYSGIELSQMMADINEVKSCYLPGWEKPNQILLGATGFNQDIAHYQILPEDPLNFTKNQLVPSTMNLRSFAVAPYPTGVCAIVCDNDKILILPQGYSNVTISDVTFDEVGVCDIVTNEEEIYAAFSFYFAAFVTSKLMIAHFASPDSPQKLIEIDHVDMNMLQFPQVSIDSFYQNTLVGYVKSEISSGNFLFLKEIFPRDTTYDRVELYSTPAAEATTDITFPGVCVKYDNNGIYHCVYYKYDSTDFNNKTWSLYYFNANDPNNHLIIDENNLGTASVPAESFALDMEVDALGHIHVVYNNLIPDNMSWFDIYVTYYTNGYSKTLFSGR